jgi:hypothetical protein
MSVVTATEFLFQLGNSATDVNLRTDWISKLWAVLPSKQKSSRKDAGSEVRVEFFFESARELTDPTTGKVRHLHLDRTDT